MDQETKEALVAVYVPDMKDLGLSFEEALALALERDDAAAKAFRTEGGEDA